MQVTTTAPSGTKAASIPKRGFQHMMKSKSLQPWCQVSVFGRRRLCFVCAVMSKVVRTKIDTKEHLRLSNVNVVTAIAFPNRNSISQHNSLVVLSNSLCEYSVFSGEYSFSSPSLDWPSAVDILEASDSRLTTGNASTSQQEPQAQKRRPIRAIRRVAGRALGIIPRLFHLSF